ncbi:hypothetical protein IM792_02435 [Mucilaginibacter sp. JRF]|uniref:hypothetical protein n=1 Tax=Mucilaginibacter sp. JRF TaxID=2780088 RepID=UPI001882B672|nr:hypothetical protein [Mucilaginibacter sp. JRF]MBE9583296.1 hypothetical protein [Mucilaginibacter sp. JRF]
MKILSPSTLEELAVIESKTLATIDVIWNFGNKVQVDVRSRLETAVEAAISRYNNESNSIILRRRDEADANCLKVDFLQGKFVSRKDRTLAYTVNFLGMVIMPVVGYLIGFPGPLVLNYFPRNLIKSELTISSSKRLIFKKFKRVNVWTWVLFVNSTHKEDKLVADYSERLYMAFKGLQMQNVTT